MLWLNCFPSWSSSSRPHRPAAPLFLQEASGKSRSHPHPTAERLRSRQTQERVRVRRACRRHFRQFDQNEWFVVWSVFFLSLLCFSFREFSSALEFLQLLNSCTEDSPSPPPPFSTPPNHTTAPGMNSMPQTTLPTGKHASQCSHLRRHCQHGWIFFAPLATTDLTFYWIITDWFVVINDQQRTWTHWWSVQTMLISFSLNQLLISRRAEPHTASNTGDTNTASRHLSFHD